MRTLQAVQEDVKTTLTLMIKHGEPDISRTTLMIGLDLPIQDYLDIESLMINTGLITRSLKLGSVALTSDGVNLIESLDLIV